jgi:hypothetical protein
MNEAMEPIHPAHAALLMGKRPDPSGPFVEISSKVLARLLDVVEFGDQLERVEKDNLLSSLKELLALEQPELWVIHCVGPNELHPMASKEAAEKHAAELAEMFKEHTGLGLRFDVIRSPFTPLEHFEALAEETIDHRDNLLQHVKALEKKIGEPAAPAAEPAQLDPSHRALIRNAISLLCIRRPVAPDVERVVADLELMLQGQATPADKPSAEWLEVAKLAENALPSIAMPAGLHPDTQDLVTRFATALAVKLHAAELKHGYSDGWKEPHWMDECRQKLIEHLAKGDPRDVAAYCAFLWHHCQCTSPAVPDGYAVVPKRMELLPEDIAVIMYHCGGDPDATELDEQYSGGILWIGEVQEDDGRLVHGLNIASTECPEEGSTTLVELATAPAPAKAQQEQQEQQEQQL